MTKQEIHHCFVEKLAAEVASITAAAKQTIATATDKEHQARSKYETFSLESSYLARGQAKRVAELTDALERLQLLPLRQLDSSSPMQLGALLRLSSPDAPGRALFLVPAAGGEEINIEGEEIVMMTPSSPLGRAVLGRHVGDSISVSMGDSLNSFTIVSVE